MRGPEGEMQNQILAYIKQTLNEKGFAPSVREIRDAMGLKSPATVQTHLHHLEQKGYITRNDRKQRSIMITQKETTEVSNAVPVVGKVVAGHPIWAQENIENYITLPEVMLSSGKHFILRVSGESMIGAGIFDGDYLVVRQQNTATNGDVVVALLGNETTVKRFYRQDDCIRLQPENNAFSPIYTNECEILGKVISMFRLF